VITIKQTKSGVWIASKTGERNIVGKGDSSVEAHCDLLERLAPVAA
jgi:hypothetical protein